MYKLDRITSREIKMIKLLAIEHLLDRTTL